MPIFAFFDLRGIQLDAVGAEAAFAGCVCGALVGGFAVGIEAGVALGASEDARFSFAPLDGCAGAEGAAAAGGVASGEVCAAEFELVREEDCDGNFGCAGGRAFAFLAASARSGAWDEPVRDCPR